MPPTPIVPTWVTDNDGLNHYCLQWAKLDAIALDTEFIRTDTFYPLPGLIQLGTGTEVFLIDPLTIDQWQPFAQLLENKTVVKVLHACSEDLEVFKRLTGTVPAALFDTQLAAAFANQGYSLGYQNLIRQLLGIEVPKDETRSDWLRRPLSDAQISYASLDVVHLLKAYDLLKEMLADKPQLNWLQEDCSNLTGNVLPNDPENAWKDVKRAWQLHSQQLAVLKALCIYREQESRRLDVPRNRVIAKGSLWPMARYQPDNLRSLAAIQDMKPRVVKKHGERLLSIIEAAAKTPKGKQPEPLPLPLPKQARDKGKLIKQLINKQAQTINLPVELLLSGKISTPILRSWLESGRFSLPQNLNGWRREVIGKPLIEQLNQLA